MLDKLTVSGIVTGVASLVAGLTLNDYAALAGVLASVSMLYFGWRRDRREKTLHNAEIEGLRLRQRQDRRSHNKAVRVERRSSTA